MKYSVIDLNEEEQQLFSNLKLLEVKARTMAMEIVDQAKLRKTLKLKSHSEDYQRIMTQIEALRGQLAAICAQFDFRDFHDEID